MASEDLFRNERAERRLLSIATRQVGVPEGGEAGYFFFGLVSDGMTRYYPFKFKRPAP